MDHPEEKVVSSQPADLRLESATTWQEVYAYQPLFAELRPSNRPLVVLGRLYFSSICFLFYFSFSTYLNRLKGVAISLSTFPVGSTLNVISLNFDHEN